VFAQFFSLRVLTMAMAISVTMAAVRAASVWKVTGSNGGTIYLGGSVHGLLSTDYPLPPAYNHAFDLSSALVI